MADKLIISKQGIKEASFTQEEINKRLEEQQRQQLEYIVVEEKPSQVEVDFAEYVLATEDRLLQIETKLDGGM